MGKYNYQTERFYEQRENKDILGQRKPTSVYPH